MCRGRRARCAALALRCCSGAVSSPPPRACTHKRSPRSSATAPLRPGTWTTLTRTSGCRTSERRAGGRRTGAVLPDHWLPGRGVRKSARVVLCDTARACADANAPFVCVWRSGRWAIGAATLQPAAALPGLLRQPNAAAAHPPSPHLSEPHPAPPAAGPARRQVPNKPCPLSELRKLGVLSWKLDADAHETDAKLAAVRKVRGYSYTVRLRQPGPGACWRGSVYRMLAADALACAWSWQGCLSPCSRQSDP